jgi:hypothetical protein
MNLKRTATIGVVGAALAACCERRHFGIARSRRPSSSVHRRSIRAAPSSPTKSRGSTNVCDRRPRRASRGRNLFTFRARARKHGASAGRAPAAAIVEAPVERAALPTLKLAGIAEDAGDDGPVRTAIISGDGQLFMVRATP